MRHIALIKFGALGDVLRTTGLLRPLLARHPRAAITWITRPAALPLLQRNPYVQDVVAVRAAFPAALRRRRFDLILSMDDEPAACALASQLRGREVIGAYLTNDGRCAYTAASAPWFRLGLLNRSSNGTLTRANALKQRNRLTYPDQWRRILRLDRHGYPETYRPMLRLARAERAAAQRWAARHLPADRVRIGMNPSAGERWSAKRLPPARAATLTRLLHRQLGARVLLYGGPDEHRSHRQTLRQAGMAAVDMGTHHSLRRFAALVDLCDVLITSDSLALHVAQALGKPAVCFFGPTAAQEIELFGKGVALIPQPSCRCFYRATCTRQRSCVAAIPLMQFVAGVRTALALATARDTPQPVRPAAT